MHQLRHAAADDLRRAIGSTGDAQMLLRHKSVATEIYRDTNIDDLRRDLPARRGDECLFPPLGRKR
jgi:integrase